MIRAFLKTKIKAKLVDKKIAELLRKKIYTEIDLLTLKIAQ